MFNLEVAHLALLSQLQSVQHNRVLSPNFFLGAELSTSEIHLSQSELRAELQIPAPGILQGGCAMSFILPMGALRFGQELS